MDQVKLAKKARQSPHALSGGRKQRVALALSHRTAVMNKVRIEPMDESSRIFGAPRSCVVADCIGNVTTGLVDLADGTRLEALLATSATGCARPRRPTLAAIAVGHAAADPAGQCQRGRDAVRRRPLTTVNPCGGARM